MMFISIPIRSSMSIRFQSISVLWLFIDFFERHLSFCSELLICLHYEIKEYTVFSRNYTKKNIENYF